MNPPAPSQRKITGVLAHGCNLHTYQWRNIVWGKPPDQLGRVPMAALVAMYEGAQALVFGTGASEKDGVLEGEATARLLWDRFDQLGEFQALRELFPAFASAEGREEVRRWLESIVETETSSQNTHEEVLRAGHIFNRRGIQRIVLVSSPTHLPRALRDARAACDDDPQLEHFRSWLVAVPSVTSYMGKSAEDVAIFEPPHRPDRPQWNVTEFLQRIHDVPAEQLVKFLQRFDQLLQEFEV